MTLRRSPPIRLARMPPSSIFSAPAKWRWTWASTSFGARRWAWSQSARDVFSILADHGWIDAPLAESLKRMVGFRNIAVHAYQQLQMPIVVAVITTHLDEFVQYTGQLLRNDAGTSA